MTPFRPKGVAQGARVASRRAGQHKHKPKVGRGQYVKAPLLRDKVVNPRWQANAVVNNPGNILAGTAIGGGLGLATPRKKVEKRDRSRDAVAGGLVGGGAAHFARTGADYGTKALAERQFKPLTTKGNYGPYAEGPHKPVLNKYKRVANKEGGSSVKAKAKYFDEHFPKGIPSGRARAAGVMLNKKPVVAGIVAGGAAIGAGVGAHRKVKKNMSTSAFGVDHGEISKFDNNIALMGGPLAAAHDAPKGKKKQAYKDAYGPSIKGQFKGLGAGGVAGAATGAAAGALHGGRGVARAGAVIGGVLGGGVGSSVGAYKGGQKGYKQAKTRGGY